jgi:hypothetical protein
LERIAQFFAQQKMRANSQIISTEKNYVFFFTAVFFAGGFFFAGDFTGEAFVFPRSRAMVFVGWFEISSGP